MRPVALDMNKFNIVFFFFCFSLSFSQSKNEKEERISSSEFPKIAYTYFNDISKKANYLKLYRETDGNSLSYEVKFKLNKRHYSIEFNPEGVLEDIEIIIKKKHIPKSALNKITSYLNNNFDRTRFLKIQEKYINNTSKSDKQFIDDVIKNSNIKNTHYEIIAETKLNGEHDLKEFTFTRYGIFKNSRKVLSSSYEHTLY